MRRPGKGGAGGGASTVTDPLGRQVIETRSPYGLVTQVQRKSGALTRTRTITYPPGVVSDEQEGEDYPYEITDEGGRVRSLRYDTFGRLTTATDLGGNVFTSEYDATSGTWKRVKGPAVAVQGQGTIQETLVEYLTFDAWDREKTVKYAGLTTPKTLYYESEKTTPTAGAAHLPYKITFPSGDRVEYDYEPTTPTGRVKQRRYYEGALLKERVDFTYTANDAIWFLYDTTSTTQTTEYVYDSAGRRSAIKFPTQTLNGARLDYEFDLLNRISKVKIKANNGSGAKQYIVGYEYDVVGRLQYVKVYDPNASSTVLYTTTYTYDDVGRVSTRTHSGTSPVTRYFYKIPQAGVAPDSWATLAPDDYVTHIEHKRNGSFVTRLTYERANGGEPSKIWFNDSTAGNWNAGETVTLSYPAGLRVGNEDWSTTSDVAYTYDAVGNRRTRAESGTTLTTTYDPGFQIYQVTGGSSTETYDYDNGGRSTYISRGGSSWTMTWTASDRLKTANRAGVTTTYAYDPAGRRTEAVKTGQTRRFIVGPTAGTDLEVIHAVTDGTTGLGAIKALYVYAGDQPIMRFTVNASTGALENPVYYLEDANGSVIAQVTAAGTTTRFRYDGFGLARTPSGYTDPAASSTFPAGAGGDFRFHGHWLEADTGFYHMRARDYDPVTGRFLSRDPVEGATTEPESYHPYVFANGNPHFFSDPTGALSLVEINFSSGQQFGGQSLRAVGASAIKQRVRTHLGRIIGDTLRKQIKGLLPDFDLPFPIRTDAGKTFEELARNAFRRIFCDELIDIPEWIYLQVPVTVEGKAIAEGITCNRAVTKEEELFYARTGLPRPDFILGQNPPPKGGNWLVGDFKGRTGTIYKDYLKPGSYDGKRQFSAIVNYARKGTYSKTALFVVATSRNSVGTEAIRRELVLQGLSKGTLVLLGVIID
ncbi:MAG TPA: RHS repeat-associated core domain-containing protein [Verrucomicrobiota bacterium]|nr:RHS repeat-associated core domain-containing protein [Verrucomicrobiota bacterium]